MKNLIVTLILIILIGCAVYYIIRQKKNGGKCIGCPHSGYCQNKTTGTCKNKSE